ncbi:MAG: ATP-grasp domain-containing protein [Leptospira sp.]|nr:ATP-grasp domain-containing protein [Leptospira sp.]NCS93962.1 ATP-grasp domain-containing protein [Leptospira sp.]
MKPEDSIWIMADIFPNKENSNTRWQPGMQEWESKESIEILTATIRKLGYTVEIIQSPQEFLRKYNALTKFLKENLLLWNLVEGYESRNREGYIPAIAEYLGVCCIGSDAYAQIISLDKNRTSEIVRNLSISTPKEIRIKNIEDLIVNKFELEVNTFFIKPNNEGSSIGILESAICNSWQEVKTLAQKLLKVHKEILIQEYLPGKEFSVALLEKDEKNWIIGSAEVIIPGLVYDQDTKSKTEMPEKIGKVLNQKIQNTIEKQSLVLVEELGVAGYARVDWKLDNSNQAKFLEINCTPGLSKIYSLFPKILELTENLDYTAIIQRIIENAKGQFHSAKRYHYGKSFL